MEDRHQPDGGDRVLVGLLGAGIGRSLTPALHEREASHHGLGLHYQTVDLEPLGLDPAAAIELLPAARLLGFAGLNITHPCKQAVIPQLDEVNPEAAGLGAVNTVVFSAGRSIGHNTDLYGFRESLRSELAGAPMDDVVVVGAGGAGVAAATGVLQLGAAHLTLVDAEPERAAGLGRRLGSQYPGSRIDAEPLRSLPALLTRADGLVHATPVGMYGHPGCVVETEWLATRPWVAEVVYRPLETELLRRAGRAGCRTMAGGRMAVLQAAAAFRLFTGRQPDEGRMLRHFRELAAAEG